MTEWRIMLEQVGNGWGIRIFNEDANLSIEQAEAILNRHAALEAAVKAAEEYMNAELASASHAAACPVCSLSNEECQTSGNLWLAEMLAMKAMWGALKALEGGSR